MSQETKVALWSATLTANLAVERTKKLIKQLKTKTGGTINRGQ